MTSSDSSETTAALIRISEALSSQDREADDVPDAFLNALYRNVPPEELRRRAPQDLGEIARSLWSFMAGRTPGTAKIRVLGPRDPALPWLRGRSAIQIVNDDMPFLVDSVRAVLHRHDLVILLIIHPVITVKYTPARSVAETSNGNGSIHESVMQIEIAGSLTNEECAQVTQDLAAVLDDVRAAVTDWPSMVGQCHASAIELSHAQTEAPAEDVKEIAAFLSWLPENNFTFLGYREYALKDGRIDVVPGSGRGILRSDETRVFGGLREFMQTAPEVEAFVRSSHPIMISKANQRSTVHRAVLLDTISVKRFHDDGTVSGQILICGLFTSVAYARPVQTIPLLRQKIGRVIERSGLPPDSHDGKALRHVLDSLPRDELFQINEQQLYDLGTGVLRLHERRGLALFVRRDPLERFLSCLVYLPRDRYSAEIEAKVASALEMAYAGNSDAGEVDLDDSPLVRLHFIIKTQPGRIPDIRTDQVEHSLTEATATFGDRLLDALTMAEGEEQALESIAQYRTAFPIAYTLQSDPAAALDDIRKIKTIERGDALALTLEVPSGASKGALRLKIFHPIEPVALSDALPILKNFGLRVLNEIPYEIRLRNRENSIWIQDLELETYSGASIDLERSRALFEEAFLLVWLNELESDGFNGLILAAGLTARDVTILRTYAKIWRQAGTTISQAYMEDTLTLYPAIARQLVDLFEAYFDPQKAIAERDLKAKDITAAINAALEDVTNLDEDKILRSFLLLVSQTLRTNFYQRDPAGAPKAYLSIKLHSREIDLLPSPRPLYEIYVYSTRMEGVHLRVGKVARGGIRWSDRKEDFRTEILGLMKAQQVKNAVIVPVGSKGGFVVKSPPADRSTLMAEVIACYRMLITGMLDLTDSYQGIDVIAPIDVVRRDGDDPYLVVAADKGTATFSDIANGIAHDYGFWLDDAFASGGSVGYDHKKMGITARGAWEAVKRHFRELGRDIQTTAFDCIGVGDMSGDVFGNGMLLSPHTRLIAAFDHRHIFIDPTPDPSVSFAERKRLFDLPRSSWADYDRSLLSRGGAVYDRTVKSIQPSPELCALLKLSQKSLAPHELIRLLLQQPVDLLWFGGIGTYVKAASESHADVRDRANDAVRINGSDIRAKVVGEGANLAVTQRGRIEFALHGGRIDTDAIDNSAGVDTSDHEVNIKIGLAGMIEQGVLSAAERPDFLAVMTDEVADLVLSDNYLQTLALSLAEARSYEQIEEHQRLIVLLERSGRLDRGLEFLPDDEALAQRQAAKRGLTRPELSVLLAYAKNALYGELLETDLPDDRALDEDLFAYFPREMVERSKLALEQHRLRREIVATHITNEVINRLGPSCVFELQAKLGRAAPDIVRAYRIVRDILELPRFWRALEDLDNQVPSSTQTTVFLAIQHLAGHAMGWILGSGIRLDIQAVIDRFKPGVSALTAGLKEVLPESELKNQAQLSGLYQRQGIGQALADDIATLQELAAALDIVCLDEGSSLRILDMARLYFMVGDRLGLSHLRNEAEKMMTSTSWQKLAQGALIDDLKLLQRDLVARVVAESSEATPEARLDQWLAGRARTVQPIEETRREIIRVPVPELAMLIVATRQLRALAAS